MWNADRGGRGAVSLRGQHQRNAFEPPHVHVWVGNEDVCRIELNGGAYMDQPPPGNFRDIMRAYARHAAEIRATWDAIHRR